MWHSSARPTRTRPELAHPLATADDLGCARSWLTSRRRDRAMAGGRIPPNIQASLSACRLRPLIGEGVTDAEARRVAIVPHPCLAASPHRIGGKLSAAASIGAVPW